MTEGCPLMLLGSIIIFGEIIIQLPYNESCGANEI